MSLIDILKLPEAKLIQDLDSPDTAAIHKKIIQKKVFLKKLYLDFYSEFKQALAKAPKGLSVEIGSGSSFLKELVPEVITTDLFAMPNIDIVLSGTALPFKDNSVSVFFLQNVLHHIQDPITFFHEIKRCLINKGIIIMIEPYNSLWGRFIYKYFHHESFDVKAKWELNGQGRLTDANSALPWIIFFRDRATFEKLFPELRIQRLVPHTPLRYLLSGGLSIIQLIPSSMYNIVKGVETILSPLNKYLGMFITIELEKNML